MMKHLSTFLNEVRLRDYKGKITKAPTVVWVYAARKIFHTIIIYLCSDDIVYDSSGIPTNVLVFTYKSMSPLLQARRDMDRMGRSFFEYAVKQPPFQYDCNIHSLDADIEDPTFETEDNIAERTAYYLSNVYPELDIVPVTNRQKILDLIKEHVK